MLKESYEEKYELSDFAGLEKEAKMFYPFKIIDVKRDPEYGYQNVYLMLIEFLDPRNEDPEEKFGLCIYDTEKQDFIEEPGPLFDYQVTPEELYKQYRFVVPGYDEDELYNNMYEDAVGGVSSPAATTLNTPGMGNAQPAASAGLNTDGPSGSGDKWGDSSIGMQTNEELNEVNLNPYDKIGAMMAKKMGTPQVFKQGDSRTNTVKQDHWNELDEDQEKDPESMDDYVANPDKHIKNPKKKKFQKVQEADMSKFRIETLDDYIKASKHVPDHPLTKVKKGMPKELSVINEDNPRENEALKDISAKDELSKLGIAFEFKEAQSGMNRTFITDPISEVMEKIEQSDWEEYGKNPENTIRKWTKGDKILTIFAEGKDLPRATITAKANESVKVVVKKIVSNSLDPYL